MGRPATEREWKTFKWKSDPTTFLGHGQIPNLGWDDDSSLSKESSTENLPFCHLAWLLARINSSTIYISVFAVPKLKIPKYQSWKYQSIKVERQSACMTSGQEGKGCHVRLSRVDKTGGAILPTLPGFVIPSLLCTVIAVPQDHCHF